MPVSPECFRDALNTISHRGPDDTGVYSDALIKLGHQRLAILDPSASGHQPMAIENENVWIVFNGEIYNHLEIREKLDLGIVFKGTSDTETILYAYLKHGKDVVNLLNGIFAFAIYDKRSNELFVARDQFGVKPLYYYFEKGKFVFGSEIKALIALPEVSREIDQVALGNYLHFLWSPGERTPFQKIRKLLPGHTLELKLDSNAPQLVTNKYYELPFTGERSKQSELELTDELDRILFQAVKRQMLSDVPVGFFISGGLDSSIIAAMARKISGKKFNGYTIDCGPEGFDGFADDLTYARQVADHLDINLIEVSGHKSIMSDFDAMIWHLDEPQADPAPLHVWNISKVARENGDVVLLGGTAGDDLFSGYRRHSALKYENWIRLFPSFAAGPCRWLLQQLPGNSSSLRRVRKMAAGLGLPRLQRMAKYYSWTPPEKIKNLMPNLEASRFTPYQFLIDSLNAIPKESDSLNQMLFWDLKYFLTDHNLNYTDKMSMAAGVEVRVPFLDMDLVEFACSLPTTLKLHGHTTKYLLKKVAERYLPHDVIYRPKTGFGSPVRKWLEEGELDDRIAQLLERNCIFSKPAITNLVSGAKSCQDGHYSVLAALASDSWLEQFTELNSD